ncbi:MAG TPA: sulfotransferase domain-containing protein, partial [Stellaceae bacterium]|nr:sulfotransferase domain-containing protein [Stellaceae bacterium]
VLGRLLPAAKFIHVIRDPRDAAVSGWYHVTRVIPDDTRRHFPTMFDYLKHFVDGWANFVPMALEFGARHPKRYAQVLYGKLSAEPEAELSRVLRFLGVSTDIDTVRRCVAATAFDRLSGGRARGQENRTSLFRKGISGDWRNHFDEATDRYAIEKAGPLMRRFGFI